MFIKDLIEDNLPFLKPSDNADMALQFMSEEHLPQLVMNDGNEVHIFEEEALLSFGGDISLSNIPPKFSGVFLRDSTHIFQAVDFLLKMDLSVCPILDEENKYIGCIKSNDLYKEVLKGQFTGEGAVIALKIDHNDYSLSDISRIVEAEGVRIERLYLAEKDDFQYQFIVKFNKKDIIGAIKGLKRFGYQVERISGVDSDSTLDKDRFGLLMKYLEI